MKTYIIGDVHGTIDEFEEILKLTDHKSPHVKIILCGDTNDRGVDSVGVVRKARELNLQSVIGNHEVKFLNWVKNGKKGKQESYYHNMSDLDIEYLQNLPYYIKIDSYIIIHAGMKPGLSIENQSKDDLIYLRFTDKNRKFISIKKVAKLGIEGAGAHFWTEFGPFGYNIVYGHYVHSFENIKIDQFNDGTACFGIDTGVCFGGRLTAFCLETKEIIQVQAKEIYYKSNYFPE